MRGKRDRYVMDVSFRGLGSSFWPDREIMPTYFLAPFFSSAPQMRRKRVGKWSGEDKPVFKFLAGKKSKSTTGSPARTENGAKN